MKNEKKEIKQKTIVLSMVCSLLVIGALLPMIPTVHALDSPTASISPTSQNVTQGTTFCIDVYVNSANQDVRGAQIQLTYPTVFTLANFTYNNLLGTSVLQVGTPSPGDTSIDYGVTRSGSGNPAAAINGNLAAICFIAPITLGGPYNFNLDMVLVDGSFNATTNIVVTDGTITVTDGAPPLVIQCNGPDNGTVNNPAQFIGNITGGKPPYTYHWEFGDGNSSTDQSPTHTYSTADTFTVTLTVMDNSSRISDCSMLITIGSAGNLLPQATITFPSEGDNISGIVNITGTATDSDGTIQKIEIRVDETMWLNAMGTTTWYFNWDTSQVIQGNHTITVRAYDELDHSHPKTIKVFVDNTGKNGNGIPGFEIVIATIGLIFTIFIKRKK